jgi:hypothetical protein
MPLLRRVRLTGLSGLSRPEKVVYLMWCFVADVSNGGSSAFFYNSSGENADETEAALRAVGCGDVADRLLSIIGLFPASVVPRDIDERNSAWNKLSERRRGAMVKAMDTRFFKLGSEGLYRQTWEYWLREGGAQHDVRLADKAGTGAPTGMPERAYDDVVISVVNRMRRTFTGRGARPRPRRHR